VKESPCIPCSLPHALELVLHDLLELLRSHGEELTVAEPRQLSDMVPVDPERMFRRPLPWPESDGRLVFFIEVVCGGASNNHIIEGTHLPALTNQLTVPQVAKLAAEYEPHPVCTLSTMKELLAHCQSLFNQAREDVAHSLRIHSCKLCEPRVLVQQWLVDGPMQFCLEKRGQCGKDGHLIFMDATP